MKQFKAFPLFLLFLALAAAPVVARAQTLFQTVTPDVLVLVQKHPSGADIVEISITAAGFPPDLLQQRIQAMCAELGYGPNGLKVYNTQVGATDNSMEFLKARFGTNGLMDDATGTLRLEPVVRAFAGIPAPHTISGLSVTFDKFKPNAQTLQRYKSPSVSLEAQFNPPPASGLEYRVLLSSQDPASITIPLRAEPTPVKGASDTQSGVVASSPWITWLLLAVTAFAFGALVYFGFLRFNAKRR